VATSLCVPAAHQIKSARANAYFGSWFFRQRNKEDHSGSQKHKGGDSQAQRSLLAGPWASTSRDAFQQTRNAMKRTAHARLANGHGLSIGSPVKTAHARLANGHRLSTGISILVSLG
jgi:hypothetical protein